MLKWHREQDQIKLYTCRADASADVVFHVKCFDKYLKDIRTSNNNMRSLFEADHKEYM